MAAADVEAVYFEPKEDDLMDEDGVSGDDGGGSPRSSQPKLKLAITGGDSSSGFGIKKTKGRGICEDADADRNNRLTSRDFESVASDGRLGPSRCNPCPGKLCSIIPQRDLSLPRRKRIWDQPDDSFVSCGVAVSGVLPTSNAGCPVLSFAGAVSISGALLMNPLKVGYVNVAKEIHAPILQQQAAAVVQKLIQPKIEEDLIIAKEIVINDADPAVRYKLTKRQTQEEIQKCTGAVVITRGKYRPPNAVPDGEKTLYLHISAGAHLKETAERILAVDRAAAMVEETLKQVSQPPSTCVYLGFDADPSLNIVARIRGPNDQYINHIINETGATVLVRGRVSGYLDNAQGEEGQQPLHLFLLSNNQKSLEDAKLLAENLLDTISQECGATRVHSCKVYSAVPPPQQLLTGVQSSGTVMTSKLSFSATSACSAVTSALTPPVSPVVTASVTTAFPYGQVAQPGVMLPSGHSHTNGFPCSQPFLPTCTSYNGYGGIYPQATPLQQVALALRQSSTVTSAVASPALTTSTVSKSFSESEKRPPQKRKFQESPATLVRVAVSQQGSSMQVPPKCSSMEENDLVLPPSKELGCSKSNGTVCTSLKSILPLPPPRNIVSMPPLASKSMPPPPPKFNSSVSRASEDNISHTSNPIIVPDTLVKLLEYGDDDDDAEENEHESFQSIPNQIAAEKPFWAV